MSERISWARTVPTSAPESSTTTPRRDGDDARARQPAHVTERRPLPGRQPPPDGAELMTRQIPVERIRADGGDATYVTGDVADLVAVEEARRAEGQPRDRIEVRVIRSGFLTTAGKQAMSLGIRRKDQT